METPSCDVGTETTDLAVEPDETWRTLRWIHRREHAAASRGSDAFSASRLMTARYVSAAEYSRRTTSNFLDNI
jgi:hypothetical protein